MALKARRSSKATRRIPTDTSETVPNARLLRDQGTSLRCGAHLALEKHAKDNRTVLIPASTLCTNAQRDPIQHSIATLYSIFSNTRVHPDRLIYALAGSIFKPESPHPFGGSRLSPGYAKFVGSSCRSLLQFIVAGAYDCCERYRDRKVMDLICKNINRVLAMHYQGMKDALDERVLKGMKKAGHIEWSGATGIPRWLRHVDEIRGRDARTVVEFSTGNLLRKHAEQIGGGVQASSVETLRNSIE
ncbi:hypothetical protein BC830DRAFT_1174725 [Chytriomyces sp. MP71]|nr:hypothetical protein BC830DRAFT_1174725 [Chytriomyces sp. MP71]